MSSAVNILNVQKTPVQTQVKTAKQTSDNVRSFLSLLQNAASAGRAENADKSNYFQNNNWNKSANLEDEGKNIVLNNGAKINDINNAKINLEDIADNSDGLAAVLTKVLNGESTELSEFDEATLAEAVKKVMAGIIVKDEDGEKIDISKVLEMLGVPAEIIPEMIAAVIDPKMIVDDRSVEKVESGENKQVREVSVVRNSPEIKAEIENMPVLISASEAEDFISKVAEYIYSERTAEIINSVEGVSEQVQENIADFANIIEESGDFKNAIVDYAVEKIEINNPETTVKMNTENIKEIIRQLLNEEPPEIELLSAVKISEAVSEKSAPTMFDILNSMKKAVNITQQIQATTAENNNPEIVEVNQELVKPVETVQEPAKPVEVNQELAKPVEIVQELSKPVEITNNISTLKVTADESLPVTETTKKMTAVNENITNNAEVHHLAGIVDARVNAQNPVSEVNIEKFATDISQVITGKAQSILNRTGQGSNETFELRLRLKPAELGEVFMKISYKNGNVGVNIVAANATAERAILSQMGDLRTSLNAQEINLAEFDVNHFNNYNQNAQNQNSGQSNENKNNRNGSARIGLNNNVSEVQNKQETERREAVANYIKSRRIFYKTI